MEMRNFVFALGSKLRSSGYFCFIAPGKVCFFFFFVENLLEGVLVVLKSGKRIWPVQLIARTKMFLL